MLLEEKLQKQLRKAIMFMACIITLLVVCGGLLTFFLQRANQQAAKELMIAEAEEYLGRFHKQLDADFQLLSSLSVFVVDIRKDRDLLSQLLHKANQKNAFLTMVYFDLDGTGVISTLGNEPVTDARLSDISSEGQSAVKQAMEGTSTISDLFESSFSKQRVFVYSVPVYDGEEIVGALAASDHIEIFSDLLPGNSSLGEDGYIYLLDSHGNFLIVSPKTVTEEDIPSIFDVPYLSSTFKEETWNALQQKEQLFSSFVYEGRAYPFLLEPVGFNGWYLFYVGAGDSQTADYSTLAMQATLLAVLLAVVFLMLYGYHLLRNYNRDLLRFAYFDPLTGAENLSRFQQRLVDALGNTGGSVAALSIRQFPFLNEIFGKEKANQLLCQIKASADRHLHKGEFFCRDTEDRFYLFLAETSQEAIRARLMDFVMAIDHGTELGQTNCHLAFYFGVATSSKTDAPQKTADTLMTHVLFALDRAKGAHTSTIWFFDAELHKQEELENYIESHMYQALRDEEFKMFLQPKKNLHTGAMEGAEALVRWQTGGGKTIFPDQFIPLFERNGFCVQLDLYMVEQACRQIRSWIDRGIPPVSISVNQSKPLFFEADYVQALTELVRWYNVPAQLITLEILERLALENVDELNKKIVLLQAEGFRISLDDFGSGYSSLNTLSKLKIDELKLDREFLLNRSGQEQTRSTIIMEQIVQIAKRLGISTVAEGVETPEDEQLIRTIGFDVGQGYLYSRPISAADFDKAYMKPSPPDASAASADGGSPG